MTTQRSSQPGESTPGVAASRVSESGEDPRNRESGAPPDDQDALREEIDRTRDELEDTVDELADRLASGARSAVIPVAVGAGVITAAVVATLIWRRQQPQRRRQRRRNRRR